MKDKLRQIGQELVEHSSIAEYSARGTTSELFPFIYAASRRMSLRAISRWLQASYGVGLTVQSISRGMKKADAYWLSILERVEPEARIFAEAHAVDVTELLERKELFDALRDSPPTLAPYDIMDRMARYEEAAGTVSEWFEYPAVSRQECLCHMGEYSGEDENDEADD